MERQAGLEWNGDEGGGRVSRGGWNMPFYPPTKLFYETLKSWALRSNNSSNGNHIIKRTEGTMDKGREGTKAIDSKRGETVELCSWPWL